MIEHGAALIRRGHHLSNHYRYGCQILEALAYRAELYVAKPKPGKPVKAMLRWRHAEPELDVPGTRYIAKATEATMGEVLDSLGSQVSDWAAGRTQTEWKDAA
jgi:hypothetical protein